MSGNPVPKGAAKVGVGAGVFVMEISKMVGNP